MRTPLAAGGCRQPCRTEAIKTQPQPAASRTGQKKTAPQAATPEAIITVRELVRPAGTSSAQYLQSTDEFGLSNYFRDCRHRVAAERMWSRRRPFGRGLQLRRRSHLRWIVLSAVREYLRQRCRSDNEVECRVALRLTLIRGEMTRPEAGFVRVSDGLSGTAARRAQLLVDRAHVSTTGAPTKAEVRRCSTW